MKNVTKEHGGGQVNRASEIKEAIKNRTMDRAEFNDAEKRLEGFLVEVKKSVKELASEKNLYLKNDEKEQMKLEVGAIVNRIEVQFWQGFEKKPTLPGRLMDLVEGLPERAKKHPVSHADEMLRMADKMLKNREESTSLLEKYQKLVEVRQFLDEERGLQREVFSKNNMTGGFMHSVFNNTTKEMIEAIESGWKSGTSTKEIANQIRKEFGVFMDEKNVIAIARGLIISGIPQGKTEAVETVVNARVAGVELSQEEIGKHGLSEREYKGIKNSVELMMGKNVLVESVNFFKENYPEVRLILGESKDITHSLLNCGPVDIASQLGDVNMAARAYKLEDGMDTVKRFNRGEKGGINWNSNGRIVEVTTSGRLYTHLLAQPKDFPIRTLLRQHIYPCEEKVIISGMSSIDGKELSKKLEVELNLKPKDSFVILVADKDIMGAVARRYSERLKMIQEKGGEVVRDYIAKHAALETPIEEIGRDLHPFLLREVQLAVMIERAAGSERVQAEL